MTASQQPDAEHAPRTSPAAGGPGSTGHDKADKHEILSALRAALAAGDPDVTEALGGRIETHTVLPGWPAAPRKERRFVTDWTEVTP